MRLPREVSAAAARRRALLFDLVAALILAVLAIALSAGLGIAGVAALVTLLILLVWNGAEAFLRRRARRRDQPRSAAEPAAPVGAGDPSR